MKNKILLTLVILGLLSTLVLSTSWYLTTDTESAEFGPNDIMVSVFQDFNGDGIRQTATEPLIPGLTLRAYDDGNTQVAQDNVGTNGNYLLNVGAGTGIHRVEVTGLSADLQPGAVGTSTVFFASASQTVMVAVENPDQYSQDNPPLVVTCFNEGPQPLMTGETFLRFEYESGCFDAGINGTCDDGGTFTDPKTPLATSNDIGSTFGVAYQRSTRSAFVASFMKRHTGFKSNGKSGVIYRVQNPESNSPVITEYVDFDALGIPTKPVSGDPHPADGASVTAWEMDDNSWDWVGKMSFGDLDISEDGETLFVVNLFDRRLYYFPAKSTPYTVVDAALVQSVALPQPCGNAIDARPFGLGVYNGKVYFSMICSGESTIGPWTGGKIPANTACDVNTAPAGNRTALSGNIYEYDPVTGMVNNTPVLTFPLNYGRGIAINSSYGPTSATWNPWVRNWTVFNRPPRPNPTNVNEQQFFQDRSYPQPMISDIEFDSGGNMVLGLRDRFGDQTGHLQAPPSGFTINVDNTPPITSFSGLFDGVAEGDILRACGSPTTGWTLESGGACGGIAGPTAPNANSNGPGGGEYYSQDDYTNFHNEITQGGMVIVPGHEDVVTIVTDPINSLQEFYDAGVVWYRNRDGQRMRNFLVFSSAVGVGGDDGPTFAKANGLGDMVALSDPTPIQIGNRVWFDTNDDGIQSPNEPGINGVTVELYKDIGGTMTKVAETVTAASATQGNGAFKFTNSTEQSWSNGQTEVLPNMDYEIRVSLGNITTQMANVNAFATQNAAGDATNNNKTDLSDSDVNTSGVIAFTTGNSGENNHTLDIGARAMCTVSGSIVSETCDGMITPDTGDDTYDIVVMATVTNGSGAYDVLVDGVEADMNITSGNQTTITVPASGGTVNITFRDAADDTCVSTPVTSGTLTTCSPLPCIITGSIVSEICDGMNTPNTGDDTYAIEVMATVLNASGAYDVLVDGVETAMNITSGTSTTITVPASGGTVDISFRDATDDTCITPPVTSGILATCSPIACDLSIENVAVQCMDETTFSVTFDVVWDFADAVTDQIVVMVDGMALPAFMPGADTGTQPYGPITVSGPAYGLLIEAGFFSRSDCSAATTFDLIACGMECTNALGGNVFNDFNNDGADAGAAEVGQANVLVEVYECDNPVPVATTYTNADGDWSIDDSGITYPVRVEFSTPLQGYLQPGAAGADNGTNVQFVTEGNCDVDYGVVDPADYCQENPQFSVACYVLGDPQFHTTQEAVLEASFLSGGYTPNSTFGPIGPNGSGNAQPPANESHIINAVSADVGTVRFMGYHRESNTILVASYMKRYAGFPAGPNNTALGTIYAIDRDNNPNVAVPLYVADAGVDVHDYSAPHFNAPTFGDTQARDLVGFAGWGDIEVDEENSLLYAINYHDNLIHVIPLLQSGSTISAGVATTIAYPEAITSLCSGDDWRPGALKIRQGYLYSAVTCTGLTSQSTADLHTYIVRIPTNTPSPVFERVTDFALNYPRQPYNGLSSDWRPWLNGVETPEIVNTPSSYYPMPHVTDIEFDEGENMVIGISDRKADYSGTFNAHPTYTASGSRTINGGDIVRAARNNDGSYQLEDVVSGVTNDPEMEFYIGDGASELMTPGAQPSSDHVETVFGALAAQPGTNTIVAPSIYGGNLGGIRFMDAATGHYLRYLALFQTPITGVDGNGNGDFFGKAATLGDVEFLCEEVPIQIGNYVWEEDEEPNGVQDACEEPVVGLPVSLYTKDNNGDLTLVATTMTGANGTYYFTGDGSAGETWVNADDVVLRDTSYLIVFGNTPESDTSFVYNNTEYGLTTDSTGTGNNPGLNDSDGTLMTTPLGLLPAICYNTADTTDHTLDVGLIKLEVFDLALVKRLDLAAHPGPFGPDSTVTFEIEVYNQGDIDATDVEVKDYVPEGLTLAPASAPDWTITMDTAVLTNRFSLAAGDSTTLSISFVIDNGFMGDTLTNRAEISNFDDDNDPLTDPPVDEDSTPNDNGDDDAEVNTPDEYADDGDGTPGTEDNPNDEDDYDFEGVPVVQTFDLALIKTLDTGATPGPFSLGSTVTFAIRVSNQGSLDATDVEVSDYIPAGLSLEASPVWTPDADTARLAMPFDLAAGASITLSISFTIDNDFMGDRIDNVAEITDAVNALGLPDEDSRPGDNGGDAPEFDSDDEEDDDGLNGNGAPDDPADSDDFDFAPIEIQRYSIGSTVFEDEANNGIQDGTDMAISNVVVQLYQVVGQQDNAMNGETDDILLDVGSDGDLATATDGLPHVTNASGDYYFSSLTPGDYYVVIPAGEFAVGEALEQLTVSSTDIGSTVGDNQTDGDDNGQQPTGAGTTISSSVINLAFGEEPTDDGPNPEDEQGNLQDNAQDANGDMTVDFGLFAPVSVGDTTFVDLDMDGVQSAGDEALPGVMVTLYDSGTMMPVAGNDVNGDPIVPLTTDAMGAYLFDNLPPGDYYVVFDLTGIDNLELYDFTAPNQGPDDSADSDAVPALITDNTAPSGQTGPLTSGETDLTLDAGIVCAIEVAVAAPFTICATGTIDLLTGASVTPASLGGFWTTPNGSGTFVDAAGDPLMEPYELGTAVSYVPAASDAVRGFVTLTLISNDPGDLAPPSSCDAVEASVRIDILNVDCGEFIWEGDD